MQRPRARRQTVAQDGNFPAKFKNTKAKIKSTWPCASEFCRARTISKEQNTMINVTNSMYNHRKLKLKWETGTIHRQLPVRVAHGRQVHQPLSYPTRFSVCALHDTEITVSCWLKQEFFAHNSHAGEMSCGHCLLFCCDKHASCCSLSYEFLHSLHQLSFPTCSSNPSLSVTKARSRITRPSL